MPPPSASSGSRECQHRAMDGTDDAAGHFKSTYIRFINSWFWVLAFFLGLSVALASGGSLAFGVPFCAVSVYFTARGLRMGVAYSGDGIKAKGPFRSRRWSWSDIKAVRVEVRLVGAMAYRRKVVSGPDGWSNGPTGANRTPARKHGAIPRGSMLRLLN